MKTTIRKTFSKMTARTAAILPAFLVAVSLSAAQPDGFNDGIDRTDPNFVTASLLVMSPGDSLYSSMGHACIRLECPKFNLDYCFSYESEPIAGRILTLLAGKLKMGMFSLPTAEFLKYYQESGRGVMQYRLNLPPDVKQRLWKMLDEMVAEGAGLPFDYVKRGCAQSLLVVLRKALLPHQMEIPNWPAEYAQTRREFVAGATTSHPWGQFVLYTTCGTEADRAVAKIEKVVIPSDLLTFLQQARINGKGIADESGKELLPIKLQVRRPFLTPLHVSCVFLGVTIVNSFVRFSCIDLLLLGFQSLLGLLMTYLSCMSDLPGASWNWLIVPFNLLPLVFWKWRQKWALYFAGVLALWEIGMIAAPHRLTDPAYLVLVGAYIIFYLKFTRFGRVALLRDRIGRACRPATAGRVTRPA